MIENFSVIESIDISITKSPIIKDFRSRTLYPSSASVVNSAGAVLGSCQRAEWFRLVDIENIYPYNEFVNIIKPLNELATQQYIFASGNMWEDFVVELLKNNPDLEVQHHVRFKNEKFHISGELDIIVKPKNFEKPFIIEMKTTNGYFNQKKIFKERNPKIENLLQCAIYVHHFRHQVCGVKLVYIDRGDVSNRTEFNIKYHEEVKQINGKEAKFGYISVDGNIIKDWSINGIYLRFKELWDKYINLEIPKCDYIPEYTKEQLQMKINNGEITKTHAKKVEKQEISGDYPCHYCKYKALCLHINSNKTFDEKEFISKLEKHRKKVYNI